VRHREKFRGPSNLYIPDRSIRSVADLIYEVPRGAPSGDVIWFRGHGNAKWKLLPSLLRSSDPSAEASLLKRFKQNALPFTGYLPGDEWDWLFLMQHHGVPTRLLDWTESPLVALYFAVESESRNSTDGCIWCLRPRVFNKQANVDPTFAADIPCFGTDEVLANYMPSKVAAEVTTKLPPLAALALRRFQRLYAQLGVFTISHRDRRPLDKFGDGKHLARLIIPKSSKSKIRRELSLLGITRLTLFPELTSVAALARGLLNG
jgi:hypothetical protein